MNDRVECQHRWSISARVSCNRGLLASQRRVNYLLARCDVRIDVFEHWFEGGIVAHTQVLDLYLTTLGPVFGHIRGVCGETVKQERPSDRTSRPQHKTDHQLLASCVRYRPGSCKQEHIGQMDHVITLHTHSGDGSYLSAAVLFTDYSHRSTEEQA